MKYKIPFTLALVFVAGTAFASTKTEQVGNTLYRVTYEDVDWNLNGILDEVSREDITPRGSNDPMAVNQVWGLTGHQTPRVAIGTVVTDEFGRKSVCDSWMPKYLGCFDISRTAYYRNSVAKAFGK